MTAGEKIVVGLFGVIVFLCAFAVFTSLGALLLMWAWNMVIAGLFHGPHIGFWQALAVSVLVGTVRQIVSVTVNKK